MATPGPAVLLQYGSNPFNARYEDLEARTGYSMSLASDAPTLVFKLSRESTWASLYPNIMGPSASFFYLGPNSGPGYVTYGNNPVYVPFFHLSRPSSSRGSTSRYFTAQSGQEYKWRITPQRMECISPSRALIATWDLNPSSNASPTSPDPEEEHYARITITPAGLSLVTEIVTTLILNRMYLYQGWSQ